MSIFASFLLLLLILVEAAPPTATSIPSLGNLALYLWCTVTILQSIPAGNPAASFSFHADEFRLVAGIYYCFNLVIIMMAVFLSSLVVNVCQIGVMARPVPVWLRKVMHRSVPNTRTPNK